MDKCLDQYLVPHLETYLVDMNVSKMGQHLARCLAWPKVVNLARHLDYYLVELKAMPTVY